MCYEFGSFATGRLTFAAEDRTYLERNLYGESFYLLGEKVIACLDSSATQRGCFVEASSFKCFAEYVQKHYFLFSFFLARKQNKTVSPVKADSGLYRVYHNESAPNPL